MSEMPEGRMLITDWRVCSHMSYLISVKLPPTALTSLSTASAALVDSPILTILMILWLVSRLEV